ncbi:MAG TPA: hypothetical protein VIJ92_09535 [Ginsengibacter sp.]
MKKNLIQLFAACSVAITLVSCSGYGHKVTFDGNHGEVYYKGDGVTEADAKAVGKFLEDADYFQKDDKTRSVQISKDSGRIQARFVVDEKAVDTVADIDKSFEIIGAAMSKQVFNNTPVDVIYTDEYFKDIKKIPYTPSAMAAIDLSNELEQMDKKNYNSNIFYYSKNIGAEKTDTIYNYLVSSGFFSKDGSVSLIVSLLPNNSFLVRFPIKSSFNNADGLQKIDAFGKELKQTAFPAEPVQLEVLGDNMDSVKTFTY